MGNDTFPKDSVERKRSDRHISLRRTWLDIFCIIFDIYFDAGIFEAGWVALIKVTVTSKVTVTYKMSIHENT